MPVAALEGDSGNPCRLKTSDAEPRPEKGGPRQGDQRWCDTRISQHLRFPQRGALTGWFPGTAAYAGGPDHIVFPWGKQKINACQRLRTQLGFPAWNSSRVSCLSALKEKPRWSRNASGGRATVNNSRVNPPAISAKMLSATSVIKTEFSNPDAKSTSSQRRLLTRCVVSNGGPAILAESFLK